VATIVPGDGVYAVRVRHREKIWPGAANVGPNPTFGENARKVEVHLIDFAGNLYGQTLAIDFIERMRGVQEFANAAELRCQLERDIQRSRTLAAGT